MKSETSEPRRAYRSELAGYWYTADPAALRRELEDLLARAGHPQPGDPTPRALIVPHAGYQYSGRTAAEAFARLAGRAHERVIVLGPSHRVPFRNTVAVPDATHYTTVLGEIPIDTATVQRLLESPYFDIVPGAQPGEHSVEIMFPFLQVALGAFRLVPLVAGQMDERAIRGAAAQLAQELDERTLLVVSTDFTHYGRRFDYVPFTQNVRENLRRLDLGAFEFIQRRDLAGFRRYVTDTGATICGREPVSILLALMEGGEQQVRLLRYETSGEITGDWTHVVSYVAAEVTGPWPAVRGDSTETATASDEPALTLSAEDRANLLRLARRAIEHALRDRRVPDARELGVPITEGMRQIAGAFVTLHKHGQLRGCIGEIEPDRELYRVVRDQALNAAFKDPRFPPLGPEELGEIDIEISVLTPPRRIASWREIEVGRHGVILRKAGRSAVFLPQVAPEQGWNVEQMLDHLAMKAGLAPTAWREGAQFEVFEALVFGERGSP